METKKQVKIDFIQYPSTMLDQFDEFYDIRLEIWEVLSAELEIPLEFMVRYALGNNDGT